MKRTYILILTFMTLVFTFSTAGYAQKSWEISLRQQLKKEKACELKFLSKVREFELAGRSVVEGRAHCIDERDYDFAWKKEKQKFELKRCQPVVC